MGVDDHAIALKDLLNGLDAIVVGAATTVKAEHRGGLGKASVTRQIKETLLAQALSKNGFKVSKSQVRMPNGPIKIVSDSKVSVSLHTDVVVEITVSVYGETA